MLCVVQRPFGGPNGVVFETDQLIEAGEFKNVKALTSQRYLRPATPDEVSMAQEVDVPEPVPVRKPMLKAKAHRKGAKQ